MSVFIVTRVLGRKKKHKLRPYKSERRRTITETGLFKKKKKKKSSTWCVRWCMVCEGPILSLTAESCVYYRWNNLSNNDTTSGILGRRASVWRHSRSSPGISRSFNALVCNIYSVCMFFRMQCTLANMHIMCAYAPPVVTKMYFWFESREGLGMFFFVVSMCVCLYVFSSYCHIDGLWKENH